MNREFPFQTAKTFTEWIGGCVPSQGRRLTYLESLHLSESVIKEIEELCDAALQEADTYLWADKIPEWNDETNKLLTEHFRALAPWMDSEAILALHRYVGWMGWHEGLINQKY